VANFDAVEVTADIVAAFVSNNALPTGELPSLLESVYAAVAGFRGSGETAATAIVPPSPAVSIRKSVTPDYLICLDDGKRFKSLRRHLATLGMTPEQYRAKWNLPSDYPMVAPNYAAQRSALAKSLGLGQLRQRPLATVPPSDGGTRVAAAPSRSAVGIAAAAVPPASADAIDAAAHGAAGVAASRAKTKGKVAASPEATPKSKSGRARKVTAQATSEKRPRR
jgi:predicted transcriptional regulator